MYKTDTLQEAAARHRELSSVLCDDLEGWGGGRWEGVQEGGYIHILIADSRFCTAETQRCKATIFQLKKNTKK